VDHEEGHNLHFMSNNIRMIKSSMKIRMQHVACIGGGDSDRTLVANENEKCNLEDFRCRLQSNITSDVKLWHGLGSSGTEQTSGGVVSTR
jgi:hypothetical protein